MITIIAYDWITVFVGLLGANALGYSQISTWLGSLVFAIESMFIVNWLAGRVCIAARGPGWLRPIPGVCAVG